MIIKNLTIGEYVARPNRFTVKFKTNEDKIEIAHLHDPGRLKELLIENTEILIKFIPTYKTTGRKTKYDVIAIKYLGNWVLINSSYHNKLVEELINDKKIKEIENFHVYKPEYTYGNSRLDFLLKDDNDTPMFLEVKGCTLVVNKKAIFPDAPTKRGKKHVDELLNIRKNNELSAIIILILQKNVETFSPNYITDPEFSISLEKAYENDVKILPTHIITKFKNNTLELYYDKQIPIQLKNNIKMI